MIFKFIKSLTMILLIDSINKINNKILDIILNIK